MLLISKSEGGAVLRDGSRRGNVWVEEVTSASPLDPHSPRSFFFFAGELISAARGAETGQVQVW